MPQRSRPLAAGMSVARTRKRLVLPLPFAPVRSRAPPAGRRNESPAKTRRSPRRQARPSATRSGSVKALGGQKGGSGGGNRSRVATVELLDRVRGLGDKPVRINLTHTILE